MLAVVVPSVRLGAVGVASVVVVGVTKIAVALKGMEVVAVWFVLDSVLN